MTTKVEAIKKVLEEFNGIATWKQIYENIEKYYPAVKASIAWKEGIRGVLYREIKNNRNFKRVGLGIFALKDYKEEPTPEIKEKQKMHPYIEGICLELGNFHNFLTYTPDKTAIFKDRISLSQLESLKHFPSFTYPEIIEEVKRIDVIWFNTEGFLFPQKVFEVVDSPGTLSDAINRCVQLFSFNLNFYIIAPEDYKNRFETKISKEPYLKFKERFLFRNYETILKFYEETLKYNEVKKGVL
nr:hypothetical protein [Chloroflexota bacterium]